MRHEFARKLMVGSLVAALVVGAGIVSGASAATASTSTGALTLMVVSPQKQAIRNDFDIETALASVIAPDGRSLQTKSPDANGRVTFSHVPAGVGYSVILHNASGYSKYLNSSRGGITITAGHHVWVEVVAQLGARIAGVLSGPPAGYTAGVEVQALTPTGRVVETTRADGSGNYFLEGLPSGSYTVEFDARSSGENEPALLDYEWQFLSGTTEFTHATFVTVAAESASAPATQLSDVDAVLTTGHSLIGKVFSSFPQDFTTFCEVHFVTTAVGSSFCSTMNATGNGFSEIVVPGDYRLEITRPSTTRPGTLITYWYAGEGVAPASTEAGAAVVHFAGSRDQTITMTVH